MELSLGFPDFSQPRLETVLARFQSAAAQPESPVRAVRHEPAAAAVLGEYPESVDPRLRTALERRGVTRPYSHQAEAFALAEAGRNLVVVTPTASGKTLCYNVPVLNLMLRDPGARAMYLFPTKALSEDQLHELQTAIDDLGSELRAFTYDGDTPQDARKAIRQRANIVLTNPDMLHAGLLPQLKRICEFYGSAPKFICSSATIANPRELAERLTGEPFELVERNGAPRGEKLFVFVNPPVVNQQLGIRRSYLSETRRVAIEFLKRNLQIIVFA